MKPHSRRPPWLTNLRHAGGMSRGPTRRVQRLLDVGEVSEQLLIAAEHDADLLAHPYIGLEHVALARLRLAGRLTEHADLQAQLRQRPIGPRGWRPRGRHSALRRRGRAEALAARDAADRIASTHADAPQEEPDRP
jgi:hypothetical protein